MGAMYGQARVLTGEVILRTLEKIFVELDELRIDTHAVSCPHVDDQRPDTGPTMYLGRRLDFCEECDRLIRIEFSRMNACFKSIPRLVG